MQESIDTALGANYRLELKLGEGATGEVWLAVDGRSGEQVAAKLLRAEHVADRELVSRFMTERAVLLDLDDPGIVRVRDLVAEGQRLAIVMDFLGGGSLRELLQERGTLPPKQAVMVAAAVLDGLAAAHRNQVLHRDVKPDNVLLTSTWQSFDPGSIRLTDFGIARLVQEGGRTATGLIGTPEYMSPELFTTGECGLSADVYGAGVLLYELIAGRTPYAGPGTDFTIAQRHVSRQPPPLEVPEPLWTIILAMLAKDPAARPTAAAAAAALREVAPSLDSLPALAQSAPPEDFERAVPATLVKASAAEPVATGEASPVALEPVPELGEASGQTVLRAMPRVAAIPVPETATEPTEDRPVWRNPKVLAALAGALLLVIGATVLFFRLAPASGPVESPAAAAAATQQDQALPTGLTISRAANYDAQTKTVSLAITYAAQKAPLRGPFLEVLPGMSSAAECPAVVWDEAPQRRNLPTKTGVTTACAWSVDVGQIPAQGSLVVNATIQLPSVAEDPQNALQQWLDGAAAATAGALGDAELTGAAYPVQRLQDIEVVAPDRIASGKTLNLVLRPVWPSGSDNVNLLYRSPSVEAPSSTLVAIAGGAGGVRFSDGCSGGVKVSADGLTVTTLTVAADCAVSARVGNFTDLSSNPFQIVTRGS